MNQYWAAWLIGMFLILGFKFSFYMHKTDPFQYSYLVKILRFYGADWPTFSTSLLSFLAELAMGSVYVNSIPLPYGMLGELPKDFFLAMLFGGLSETLAPYLIKLVTKRFSGGE